jgi:hypothetical protein
MNRFQTIYASKETGRWGIFDHQYDLGIIGLIYVQDVAASTWVFRHNQNKLPFLLEFFQFTGDGKRIDYKPDDVEVNNNVITVSNGIAITGTIVVIFANPVEFALPTPTPSHTGTMTPTPTPTITPTPTLTPTPTAASSGLLFAQPMFTTQNPPGGFSFFTFSDSALTQSISANTATITNVTVYSASDAVAYNCDPDINNCNLVEWVQSDDASGLGECGPDYSAIWGSGPTRDSSNQPFIAAPFLSADCSYTFDPTTNDLGPITNIPELNYDSDLNTINGISGPWVFAFAIETDIGNCILICGNSFCF